MSIGLYDYQKEALGRMKNGCILCGGVGSGKSRTALAYFYQLYGGNIDSENYIPMKEPPDLYIITTARKRDTCEWEGDMIPFRLTTGEDPAFKLYKHKVTIDSWNNIPKYRDVENAFFIFDEQRVVGTGVWVKAFIQIAKHNKWILLSATPGDTWQDYAPVFIANGFFKNISSFRRDHVIYSSFTKYPKIDRYINEGRLIRLRNSILIDMDFKRKTVSHHETVLVDYDKDEYKNIVKTRWNFRENRPIETAAEFCGELRRVVNSDISRQIALLEIIENHPRVIVFYNYDYELDILRNLGYPEEFEVAEWNGHKHQPIPDSENWVYLVQYVAGAEGWNCIKTDTIVFYSQTYSYKVQVQSSGRIDRLNTPYIDLYYYHVVSRSGIDMAIGRALNSKKQFNEGKFYRGFDKSRTV